MSKAERGETLAALRYFCLSDLHLGAAYSVLTHIDDKGRVALDKPGHTLTALAAGLRQTIPRLSDGEPPTLILMGDVLDMGLSKAGQVARAFLWFIDALFPAGEPPIFAKKVICMPGNHDHHLWRMAQDDQFLSNIGDGGAVALDADLVELTPMFGPHDLRCRALQQLMRTRAHLADAQVSIAYPNLGLKDAAGDRAVVLHHGHYVDGMYRAMSRLQSWLSGAPNPPKTVKEIETENGPWIDFLWSNLGSAGAIGRSATTLYETMLDAGAAHTFAEKISDRVTSDLGHSFGLNGRTQITHGITVGEAIRGIVDLTAGSAAQSQRDGYRTVLSTAECTDLAWYLSGPVSEQFRHEGVAPKALSFIFGHTHKPFQDQISVPGFDPPTAIYNTGGWVMDQPTLMPCQGAAAMLIDEALNIASLRLFNDPVNEAMTPVHAAGLGGFLDAANPLLAATREAVTADAKAWAHFSDQARAAMEKRAADDLDEFSHLGRPHVEARP